MSVRLTSSELNWGKFLSLSSCAARELWDRSSLLAFVWLPWPPTSFERSFALLQLFQFVHLASLTYTTMSEEEPKTEESKAPEAEEGDAPKEEESTAHFEPVVSRAHRARDSRMLLYARALGEDDEIWRNNDML